jgi:hypothetical protein
MTLVLARGQCATLLGVCRPLCEYLEPVKPSQRCNVASCSIIDKSDSPEERIYPGPFGVSQKRVEGCAFPTFLRVGAIHELMDNWKSAADDVIVNVSPVFAPCSKLVQGVLNIVQQQILECQPAEFRGINVDYNIKTRYIELSASHFNLEALNAMQPGPAGLRCLFTRTPPWLRPGLHTEIMQPRDDSSSDGSAKSQTVVRTGARTVVLCSDPRFMLMNEILLYEKDGLINKGERLTDMLPLSKVLDKVIDNDVPWGGGVMNSVAAWAREEAERPSEVRLFFLEDFLTEPEIAVRGLLRFLDLPADSFESRESLRRIQEAIDERCLLTWRSCGSPEVEQLKISTQEFERSFSDWSYGTKAIWTDQLNEWIMLPHPRLSRMASLMMVHECWEPQVWWAAHSARMCRPCTFFPRGLCKTVDDCAFCHFPGHPAQKSRPGKKERNRRDRQKGRNVRTPSPPGLSS